MHPYTLIETQGGLKQFIESNTGISWMCFDTEFVGEKRFVTRLCLIQVSTRHGHYLIDPFTVGDLSGFLSMIQDPGILKITHAGENDYRLLYGQFGVLPRNVFDTQIGAAFVGYKYPVAFKKLVEIELRIRLKKGYTVADWESRPFKNAQLEYALDDILHLHDLWQILADKLKREGRSHWANEEFLKLEEEGYYRKDPHQEALTSPLMKSLNQRERLFLLRLFDWRRRVAEEKNYSKEMVLPGKFMSHIVRSMHSGKASLEDNRRIPFKIANEYWEIFARFYRESITEEERALLKQIPGEEEEDPREETLMELIYLIIKHHCLENGISPNIAFPRNALHKIRDDAAFAQEVFGQGWRKELFGAKFTQWLEDYRHLNIHISDNRIELLLDHE